MSPSDAAGVGTALAAMLIYILMAVILAFKPKGLFAANG
jgi:branched-chain amino acid transport system permease protein